MWDDSSDSMSSPSPDARKKGGKSGNAKYDFPTSFSSKGKKGSRSSSQKDIDQLFGSESTDVSLNNSPVAEKRERNIADYALPEPTKSNYFSNFAATSGDFEDSILGELLGGVSSKPKTAPPKAEDPLPSQKEKPAAAGSMTQGKLEPIDDGFGSKNRTISRHQSTPLLSPASVGLPDSGAKQPQKSASFRFATDPYESSEGSPLKPQNRTNSDDVVERIISEPSIPASKRHHNSFDMDINIDSSGEFKPTKAGYIAPATFSGTTDYKSTSNATGFPGMAKSLDRGLPQVEKDDIRSNSGEDKDSDDVGVSFVPSFMDPGRQGRRRRQLDRHSSPDRDSRDTGREGGRNVSKFDELDAMLGLGAPSAASKVTAPAAKVRPPTFHSTNSQKPI